MATENDIRYDRHCVFMMHVHLVFVTKYRREVFTKEIKKKLWGGALWSPSYFAGSCGGAPIAVIRQTIEQQQTPH